jgi:hypothetical protein
MEKKKLNEDAGLLATILTGAVGILAFWALKKAFVFSVNGLSKVMGGGDVIPTVDFEKIYARLMKNREFLKDFTKIIMDEGGIDDFIKKTKTKTKEPSMNWTGQIAAYGYQKVSDKNFDLDFGPSAKNVVNKLIKTNSFKRETSKLSKSEIQYIANVFFAVIISPDFEKEARDIIAAQLKKNSNKLESSMSLKKLIPKNIK